MVLLLTGGTVEAQTVITPSDRVATRLNVREEPRGDSVIVGKLEKNETAELIEAVPYWYKIRLHDGVEGFVSKSWSDEVPATAPTDQRIRLGAWNIKKLGHGSSKNYAQVVSVIESNFDVLAVVEVMQKQQGHPGYDRLIQDPGNGWAGLITDSPRPNTTSGSAEFYAIVYRVGVVRPCSGWTELRYYEDNDGSDDGTGADDFAREPAFACFEAGLTPEPARLDFVLAAYHATWSDGDVPTISAEAGHLGEVFTAMAAAVPGEDDLLIAGDFNLKPAQLASATTAADRTTGTGSTLNSSGARTSNLYDHVLVHNETNTSEMLGNARVLDVRQVTATNQLFYSTVSDHLPIVVEMRSSGPGDD